MSTPTRQHGSGQQNASDRDLEEQLQSNTNSISKTLNNMENTLKSNNDSETEEDENTVEDSESTEYEEDSVSVDGDETRCNNDNEETIKDNSKINTTHLELTYTLPILHFPSAPYTLAEVYTLASHFSVT